MNITISIVYDLIFIAVVLWVALRGKSNGLLAGIASLVGTVVGVFGAVWAARTWAGPLYTDYLGVGIGNKVNQAIAASGGDFAAAVSGMEMLPESIRTALAELAQDATGDIAPRVITALEPLVLPLVQALIFLVACLVIKAVFALVVRVLRSLNHLPLLGTLNQMLGFAFGFVTGLVDCWLLSIALWLVASLSGGEISFLTEPVLNGSYLYRIFATYNPFLAQ